MALYEYYCFRCDLTFERNVKIEDRDKQKDCQCGYPRLDRKITFNGSVWAPSSQNGGMKR